jgi:hypothetical protein
MDDLVKRLQSDFSRDSLDGVIFQMRVYIEERNEAADRIEQLEKGFRDILTLDDPMLMQMISKACLTSAIDADGKYCFVPPFALGEKKDAD